jgi:hypothetical protein
MSTSLDILIGLGIAFLLYGWKKGYFWICLFIEVIIFLFIVMMNTLTW